MTTLTPTQIHYPDSDGKPMADNTKQFRWIQLYKGNFDVLFAEREDVFVAGDLLWYPVQGQPKIRQAPDVLVAFGRPKGDRGSYKQWEEGNTAPQVVFEILSPGNTLVEMINKHAFYHRYGVHEYYLHDPDRNEIFGWLRENDELRQIEQLDDFVSPLLEIRFAFGTTDLQIFFPDGRPFVDQITLAQKNDRLAAKLRELGIDPETV
jgi:Uma2 family endonuclease